VLPKGQPRKSQNSSERRKLQVSEQDVSALFLGNRLELRFETL
jgi:hypothetical protein